MACGFPSPNSLVRPRQCHPRANLDGAVSASICLISSVPIRIRMLCSDSPDGGIDVIHSESVTTWDDETDVIVAGSGGGLVGAYTAAREGLSVMVVEASDQFGGTTAYSGGGGMWFPCNPVLRRAGSDDTLDAAFAYFHAVVGNRTLAELQRTYVYGGSDLIAYLEQDAHFEFDVLPWPDYFGGLPHARLDGLRPTRSTPLPPQPPGGLAPPGTRP